MEKKTKRTTSKSVLTRRVNELRRLVAEDDTTAVEEKYTAIRSVFREFEEAHISYHDTLTDEKEIEDSDILFTTQESFYITEMDKVRKYLSAMHKTETDRALSAERKDAKVRPQTLAMKLPNAPHPEVFSGKADQFPMWKASFHTLVGKYDIGPDEKMYYLKQYTTGEAREAIEALFLCPGQSSYDAAMKIMEERFGKASLVSAGLRRRLEAWPRVLERDGKGLQRFSDFLAQLLVAKQSYPALDCLDDEFENQKILKKLPTWLVKKWIEVVVAAPSFPTFEKFCAFLADKAKVENHSLWELHHQQHNRGVRSHKEGASHALESEQQDIERSLEDASSLVTRTDPSCPGCGEAHAITNCRLFAAMSLPERKEVIHKKGLCFGCLGIGHRSRECRIRHTCQVCSKRHPTLLHEFGTRNPDPVNHAAESSQCRRSTTSTLPVVIRNTDNGKEMRVFALLDTQSNTHFAATEVLEAIGACRRKATLKLKTMNGTKRIETEAAINLEVRGLFEEEVIKLESPCYGRSSIPCNRESIPTDDLHKFQHLSEVELLPASTDLPIGLLIGYHCAEAFKPKKFVCGRPDEPFAWKTTLGWCIMGGTEGKDTNPEEGDEIGTTHTVHGCISLNTAIMEVPNTGFDHLQEERSDHMYSAEDHKFMRMMNDHMRQGPDGRYEAPLPLRGNPQLPSNVSVARKRLNSLKSRMERNPGLQEKYKNHMQELFDQGWAEEMEELEGSPGRTWYIPHQGVFQHDKLRVVFDCSAEYQGGSLNDHLLPGPNLMNQMLEIILRFRLNLVALTCDIQKMFYQFVIPPEDRDLVRFLWWKEGDLTKEPIACRMTVHLFGAVSSPGVATYGLRRIAEDHREGHAEKARKFVLEDFYVDDGVTAVPRVKDAVDLFTETQRLLSKGNLKLHKVLSNSKEVMECIPEEHQAKVANYPLASTLGQLWNLETDKLVFPVRQEKMSSTKRELLSALARFFDPAGMIAPLVLQGRMIFHQLCKEGISWDEEITGTSLKTYKKWSRLLEEIGEVLVERPLFRSSSCEVLQLHHFADACLTGYAACSYTRSRDKTTGEWQVSLVLGKCRVVPIKPVLTVPRLELMASVLSVQLAAKVRAAFPIKPVEFFWTDSTAVLGYIQNEAHRFKTFVANRVQRIHDGSDPKQWHHIPSEDNPADDGSRGVWSSRWLNGPEFLRQEDLTFSEKPGEVDEKECKVLNTETAELERKEKPEMRFSSSWYSTTRIYAWVVRFIDRCRGVKKTGPLEMPELDRAKLLLVKMSQESAFGEEHKRLTLRRPLGKESPLYNLDPFLDGNGLIRVGGRIRRTSLDEKLKFPYVLPGDHTVSTLVIRHFHEMTHHQGRGMTCSEIRSNGFWIVRLTKLVKSMIRKCIICNRLRGKPLEQKMADLPPDRAEPGPPFLNSGCDVFGPFLVKSGRKNLKRYAVLFTCLASRAVHLEVVFSLTTDSFLSAFRRLAALRGPVALMRGDQGTNFMGARESLLRMGCEFVPNTPKSSHRGGAWERMIGVARRVIEGILYEHSTSLDDEGFSTLLAEATQVMNSRPLSVDCMEDPQSLEPLTPNHLITMKSKVVHRNIPVDVGDMHLYASKQWKRVQFLTELFWSRWKKEVLHQNASRRKWQTPKENLTDGDVVMLIDDLSHRSQWKLGRVVKADPDKDGLVRTVTIRLADRSTFIRPVQKLIHLMRPPSD